MLLFDRLSNVISGLATGKDKTSYNRHVHVPRGTDELLAAYRDNWLARKVVDIVPFDMLREWRSWKAKDEQIQALEAAETALDLRRKLNSGMVCGRLYGGGGILIGDGAANPREELIIDRLPKGGIKYLHVLSRHELGTGQLIRDPLSPYYGRPEYYRVASGDGVQIEVHPSRIVPFFGAPLPEDWRRRGEFWSDSILQAVLEPADQATSAAGHIAAMLPEALTEVVSIPGLTELVSTAEGEAMVSKRLSTAKLMRSLFNVTLIDGTAQNGGEGGDTWQQKQLSFDTLPDVGRFFLQIAAGAADVPATRLLSQSPDGMNATGDSDTRNYYDHCAARQKVELSPTIRPLDRCLIRHALGDEPPEVWYDWNPLYQESQKEKADTFKVVADAIVNLNGTGLIPPEVLARGTKVWLQDSGQLPGIDAAYAEHGDAPLTEGDANADQFDEAGNPGEGNTQTGSNIVPFRARAAVGDAAPRTLYVSRKLTNAADVLSWAKDAGIPNLMLADSLHVTIAYSRQPVDWMKVGDTWQGDKLEIPAGGPRLLERFGDALVLAFASGALQCRHQEIKEAGASWDHSEYQPHVTLSWDAPEVDVSALAAYNGPLVFGPEVFEPVNEDWRASLTGDAAAVEPEEATEEEIAAVTGDDLRALFGPEMLEGVRLTDKAPGGRMSGIVAAFNELLHPRGPGGKFAPKGTGSAKAAAKPAGKAKAKTLATEEKLTKGAAALKTAGVSHDDEIAVMSKRVKAYAGAKTVRDFVDNHPKGKAYALRKLAADHEKGVISFKAAGASTARPTAPEKYNADNFSDFSDTDHRTTMEVERDLYKTMLIKPETASEKTSIGVYSGNGYSAINGHLRGNNPASPLMKQNIGNIDSVLARSKIPEDTVVYRGIKPPFSKEIMAAKVGSTISDPGYVSTSLKGDTSKKFATPEGVVLKMLLPKGNSAYVMNGRGASHYPKEHEILLPRGSRFRVKSLVGNVMTVEVL